MPAQIATVVYIFGIVGLFVLVRDHNFRTSKGLWIPVVWLWILGSRELSKWLVALDMQQSGTLSASPAPPGSSLDEGLFAVLLILGVIVLLRRGSQVGRLLRANGPIVLFFLYCGASVLWSDFAGVSFKRWIKALGDIVMVMVVLTDPDWLGATKRFLVRSGFLLVPVSILLIKYYPTLGRSYHEVDRRLVFTGVTNDKNALGVICLLFGLASVWRILHLIREPQYRVSKRSLIAHGVLLAMVLWLFWRGNSMTCLACFALASSVMVAISLPALARKPRIVHLLVAAAVTLAAVALFLNTGGDMVKALGKDPTLTGRTEVWKEVLNLTENPVFGTGFESFWLGSRLETMWNKHWWHPNEAHNGYLEIYLNLGWIGVMLLAAVIVTGYRNVLRLLRRDPEAGRLMLAFFVVEMIYSFTEAGFRMMNPVWICFLLAAAAVPRSRSVSNPFKVRESMAETAIPGWHTPEVGAYRPNEAGYKPLAGSLFE
jgi:exopolysaccharide production protein ExoQ